MIFKERLVHFLQESSEKLKLTYQSTLQSIQIINVIDTLHRIDINKAIAKQWTKGKCFALALLRLCCKLFEVRSIHMREFVKLIEKRYQDFAVEDLERQSLHAQGRGETEISCDQIEEEITQFEMRIVLWLRWKVSMPLLYDDVIMIAYAWDNFTLALSNFPLIFEAMPASPSSLQNHNYLVNSIRICLYNFNHLIKNTSVQNLSHKIHKIAIGIFITAIKFLMKEKLKQNKYALNPKISINFILEDFLRKQYQVILQNMEQEIKKVLEVLNSYKLFKQKSKGKRDPKLKDDLKKKYNKDSKKQSEDKENIMYYVNRARSKSKQHIQLNEGHGRQQQSRSKSRKDKTKDSKDNIKLTKKKEVKKKFQSHKNKSNSAKSIASKNISLVKREKSSDEIESKKEKKLIKCNMSNASKHVEKSHLPSKITAPAVQNYLTMKSAYWLHSTTLAKTDKKSTNSSIRMKIR